MTGNVHHPVAHSRTDENTYGSHKHYPLERGGFGADSRRKEVDGIIAHPYRQVHDRQQKQKHHDAQKQYVHMSVSCCVVYLRNKIRDIMFHKY